jgi:hypothetical protein
MSGDYAYYCNTSSSGTDKQLQINSYNAVYKLYYDNVIANPRNKDVPLPRVTDTNVCTTKGGQNLYCPEGTDAAKAANAQFKNSNGTVTYSTLKFYLDDCATKLDATDNYYIADTSFNNIMDTSYNMLKETRNDLDIRMKEILGNNQSISHESQNYIDGSVYTTLLWTVLATSLIYYTFTKI